MSKILLLLEHKENRRLLLSWLTKKYRVCGLDSEENLSIAFDLCIVDGRALDKFNDWVIAIKKKQEPLFLPFLLITSKQDVGMSTRHLWRSIDELIITPIEKLELQARVEMLLQRRQLSLKLQSANQDLERLNKLKSHFISIASHELRNPLNLISGYAQLLIKNHHNFSSEQRQDLYQRIFKSVKNMKDTLNDVLLLTKGELAKQKFNLQPLDLNRFCRILVSDFQLSAGNSHQINLAIEDKPIIANVDRQLLERVLTNLLSNAIKYSPENGSIELELTTEGDKILLKVKDNGIGIPLKDKQQLFSSFYRASNVGKIPGTGLGLAIVKQSIELQGGTITCESEVDRGTTFTVILPQNLD
jgi:signal transduction histidine kinase